MSYAPNGSEYGFPASRPTSQFDVPPVPKHASRGVRKLVRIRYLPSRMIQYVSNSCRGDRKTSFGQQEVVEAYANIRMDTLHMKNLLHVGEDIYLTTLLLKFHSKYNTKYTMHAHAWTVAPDSWKYLCLSIVAGSTLRFACLNHLCH